MCHKRKLVPKLQDHAKILKVDIWNIYVYLFSENSSKKSNFTLCLIYRIQNIHFLWFSNRKISLTNWFSHAIYIPSKHTSSCKKYQRWTTRLSFCLIPPLAKNLKVILFHCVVFKFTCWSIIFLGNYIALAIIAMLQNNSDTVIR